MMKKILLFSIALLTSMSMLAENPLANFADIIHKLGGEAEKILSDKEHAHLIFGLAEGCQVEVVGNTLTNEIMLIYTTCAPICSSCVRVYKINGEEWIYSKDIEPTCGGIFPQAFWENDMLVWRDNTPEWQDQEEYNRP